MHADYPSTASPGWKQARRAAFIQDIVATLRQHPESLLSFDQISQKLNLADTHYLDDLQEIPLDHIVGSVGRYTDFTRAFLPRQAHLQERWQKIEKLLESGRSLPPIELYQVGEAYFVRDGNHRVSVARQRGFTHVQAHVWKYDTPIPLQPDSDVDELLCQVAHEAFLERTHLDQLCPELKIAFTQPGGYEDLVHEIETYQQILSEIDQREIPLDEAVVLWSELRYIPVVQIIRERRALAEFPSRTEADLYLWLGRNRQALATRYEHQVLMQEAADDLAEQAGSRFFSIDKIRKALAHVTVNWWHRKNE
jgi:hypothetical protein